MWWRAILFWAAVILIPPVAIQLWPWNTWLLVLPSSAVLFAVSYVVNKRRERRRDAVPVK